MSLTLAQLENKLEAAVAAVKAAGGHIRSRNGGVNAFVRTCCLMGACAIAHDGAWVVSNYRRRALMYLGIAFGDDEDNHNLQAVEAGFEDWGLDEEDAAKPAAYALGRELWRRHASV